MVVDPDSPLGEPREFVNEILPNLDCSKLGQLVVLDVTNHTNLSELTINKCTQLQELYARGTILKSIELPATTSLKKIYLGSELTSLELVDLTGIEEFVVEGLTNCGKLTINNCGTYMAKESYKIVQQAIGKLTSVYDPTTNPNVCTLRGIDWTEAGGNGITEDLLKQLIDIYANITGKIKVRSLSNDLKMKIKNNPKYGDIDNPDNALWIDYKREYINDINISNKIYVYAKQDKDGNYASYDYEVTFKVIPENANTFDYAEWKLSNNKYATINAKTGVITRNAEICEEGELPAELTVTIYQIPESDGVVRDPLTKTVDIYFYERVAKPGDIVFNDGTYSDELDPSKTPIGVCFYIDPNDKTRRLMCALDSIKSYGDNSVYRWGCNRGFPSYVGDSGVISQWYGPSNQLEIEGSNYNCYDIAAIDNSDSRGINYDSMNPTASFSDTIYRDTANADNGYFKFIDRSTQLGDLGWNQAKSSLKVDYYNIDGTTSTIRVNANDVLPSGYYKTLAIIEHRNKILNEYKNAPDFTTGEPQEGAFNIPKGNEFSSELTVLNSIVRPDSGTADKWCYEEREPSNGKNTYGSCLYYPAASACFAYEPVGVANLSDKFKIRKWFLPAAGDMFRIMYYLYQSYNNGQILEEPRDSQFNSSYKNPANAFTNAIKLGVLNAYRLQSGSGYLNSTEPNDSNAMHIGSNGSLSESSKYSSGQVLPICVF